MIAPCIPCNTSFICQKGCTERQFRVQTIFSLIEYDGLVTVHHLGGDLFNILDRIVEQRGGDCLLV